MGKIGEGEASSGPSPECCMCGDHGLSSELFTCKSCGFRSQHKYCSSLYPGAQSYHICNWCLTQKDDDKNVVDQETTKSSQNSSHKATTDQHETIKIKIKKMKRDDSVERRATTDDHSGLIIKKQMINKLPPPSAGRKRVVVSERGGISEREIIKRSRSESNGGMIVKPVFRNKVRRYKLLDEVSS